MVLVSAQAQKHQNVREFGLNYRTPKVADGTQSLVHPGTPLVGQGDEKGNSAQAFGTLQTLFHYNPALGYHQSGNIPIVFDPTLKTLFLIWNEQTTPAQGVNGTNLKMFTSGSPYKTFSTTPKIFTTSGTDFYGMPQLAVMNPDGATTVDGLNYLSIVHQYPQSSGYYYTTPTMFLKSSSAVADPYALSGPADNNSAGYAWGAGGLLGFANSSAQGAILGGVLDPPNATAQYGQYGVMVYDAASQEAQSSLPTAWANSQFRSTPSTTNSYNGPMYTDVDPKGVTYAICNSIFADDQNNRVLAFSKSTNGGKSWSDFTRMPTTVLSTFATSEGLSQATVIQPYQQDAFMVTDEDKFSYFCRLALFDGQDSLRALEIAEVEYSAGNWSVRKVADFNDVPIVFTDNDSVNKANNYSVLKPFRIMNTMGNELEVARTADNKALVLKWIDVNPDLGADIYSPARTVLIQDQQTGTVSEGTIDSIYTTDVFIASRALGSDSWSKATNVTHDKVFDKGTHMPRMVPSLTQIPMISAAAKLPSAYTGTSDASKMYAALPQAFLSRIFNAWSTVNYGLFAAATPVEEESPVVNGSFALNTPQPNPSVNETEISYTTNQSGHVRISVMNVLGQTVATLLDTQVDSGVHGFVYNTSALTAGSYYLNMTLNGTTQTRSFVVSH